MRSAHSLVIGGTGMLAAATHSLIDQSRVVTLLARRPDRLPPAKISTERTTAEVSPLPLDLADREVVLTTLRRQIDAHGPIERAILWIHSTYEETALAVLRLIDETSLGEPPPRIVRVLGSAAGDPTIDLAARLGAERFPHVDLRAAVLGFELEGGVSRWLTHEEISRGALALLDRAPREPRATPPVAEIAVVGRIEPWSARP